MAGKGTKHKGRKPGDWKVLAASRSKIARDLIKGHGYSGAPTIGDVGSAAYRRMRGKTR